MKVRVISAVIASILLVAIVFTHQIVVGVAVFILALIGVNEFYSAVNSAGYKPIRIIGYLSCIPILFIGMNGVVNKIDTYIDLFKSINYFSFGLFIIIVILFSSAIFLHDRYNLNDISLTVFGIIYVPFLFSFLVLTRNLGNGANGFYYIWLIIIGAFATDTFAYFSGLLFGKTKLLPAISPKKTVEGSIGGIAGCIAVTVLYGIFINRHLDTVPLYHYIVIGVLNGMISQVGDWAASSMKRYVNIKDYGKIMPGHGGVLDRFDSILFTAPVVYFYINFIILK